MFRTVIAWRFIIGLQAFFAWFPVEPAPAEIYKLAIPTNTGFELYWWPVLPALAGWHHDESASEAMAANILVPDGQTFAKAAAIIYAKADYKPRMPEIKSLNQLVANDRAQFSADFPGIQIVELTPMRDGDGQVLRCLSFAPRDKGSWEIVAYGQEGDDYLIFTVGAFTHEALKQAAPDFDKLVSTYKAKL